MLASLVLVGVYVAAAFAKLRSWKEFAEYLRPLTNHVVGLAGLAIAIEVGLVAVLSVAIVDAQLRFAAGMLSAAFLVVAAATYSALLARRAAATCHCFGRMSAPTGRVDAAWLPAFFGLRNTGLFALSFFVADVSTALLVSVVGVIPMLVALGLLAGVLRERALMRVEVHPTAKAYGPGMRTLMAHIWWVDGHPRPF